MDSCRQLCGEGNESTNHMIFQCRIACEIWDLALIVTPTLDEIRENSLIQNIKLWMANDLAGVEDNMIYIGWRIWKVRNTFIFSNKRENIPQVINNATMDNQQWDSAQEAAAEDRQEIPRPNEQKINYCQQVTDNASAYYCLVDASWITSYQNVGIGWSLYSREGIKILQGSSVIAQTSNVLQAETKALLQAVRSLKTLGYTKIIFMGDSKKLYATLQSEAKVYEVDQSYNASIAICVRDILDLAKNCAYKFVWVPRNHVVREDKLAMEERHHNKPYAISWIM